MNDIIKSTDDLARVSSMFSASGYFSDAKDAAQAGVKIMAGMEMGFGPFASMTGVHIIQGKPAPGAHLMAAAIKASGKYDYRVREHTDKACRIEFFQRGESIGVSEFTAADAKAAKVKNMDAYPKNMLFARAISNGMRWYCPDVFSAPAYTPEELGADVDADGDPVKVVDVTDVLPATEVGVEPTLSREQASRLHKALGGMKFVGHQQDAIVRAVVGRDVRSFTELTVDESKAIYAAGQTIMEGSATPRDYGIKEIEWSGPLEAEAV